MQKTDIFSICVTSISKQYPITIFKYSIFFGNAISIFLNLYSPIFQVSHSRTEGLKPRERISDDIIIYDVTDDNADEDNIPVIPEPNEDVISDPSK